MTKFARALVLGLCAVCMTGALGAGTNAAQKAKPAKDATPAAPLSADAQKAKDAASVRANFENGVKSYQAGKLQPAVDDLSAALRGGGLASADMARALYVRGLAYKKQSKPGLAISDLTSALWLKNGLNDADRQSATNERAEAYRMAGLGDGNSGAETVAVADPNVGKSSASSSKPSTIPAPIPAAAGTASSKPTQIVADGVTRQAPESQAAIDAANARKMARAAINDSSVQTLPGGPAPDTKAAVAAPQAVAVAEPAPVVPPSVPIATAPSPVLSALPSDSALTPPAAPAASAPTSTIAGFFSNLFKGDSSAPPAAPAPVTTASTTPSAETSSWSQSTSVAEGAGKAKTAKAAAVASVSATSAAAAPPVAVKSGKYKVHIAAVRSRPEAEALAQRLLQQHGADLKNRTPQVDEAVIGSMGTFYRVRVSGYATPEEPRAVCNTLRTSGFDCLVVTN